MFEIEIPVITRHKHLPINQLGRDFFVGDVHGQYQMLLTELNQIDFDPATDRLISSGDFIDRGPNSPGCLALLEKSWFHATLGNHEQLLLASLAAHIEHWHQENSTIAPSSTPHAQKTWLAHCRNGGQWLQHHDAQQMTAFGQLITKHCSLSLTVATGLGDIGVSHAAAPDDWQAISCEQATFSAKQITKMLWDTEQFKQAGLGHINTIKHIDKVIHGHVNCQRVSSFGNQIWIDTLSRRNELTLLESSQIFEL